MIIVKNNKTGYELVIVAVAVIFLLAIGSMPFAKNVSVEFQNSGVSLNARVADTPYSREKGLMFVQNLPENSGMLFIFESPQELRFWMKNTRIPLDIIFVSKNFTVVNIVENAKPCSDYCPLFYSSEPAKYVVEANAGFAKKRGIKVWDSVRIG